MMRKLRVEFKYFDKKMCSRCRITDENARKTMQKLREALRESGVIVEFKTTKLPASRLAESNSILINGRDVEELVCGKKRKQSSVCLGCGELLNGACECRTYSYRGKKYRYAPKTLILEAIRKTIR